MTETAQTEADRLVAAASGIARDWGAEIQRMVEAAFPGVRVYRDQTARLGYVGARSGWYPAKPKGWRP